MKSRLQQALRLPDRHAQRQITGHGLEAANHRAERAIRPAALVRKMWGGHRTWNGARRPFAVAPSGPRKRPNGGLKNHERRQLLGRLRDQGWLVLPALRVPSNSAGRFERGEQLRDSSLPLRRVGRLFRPELMDPDPLTLSETARVSH